jgi:alpha-mannosidase
MFFRDKGQNPIDGRTRNEILRSMRVRKVVSRKSSYNNLFWRGSLIMLFSLVVPPARAQDEARKAVSTLSAPAQDVIKELSSLERLPSEGWRYHAGDEPHGQAPDLDDSSWPLVNGDSRAPAGAMWYRRWIEVPKTLYGYDLTGARIWFHFDVYVDGPMQQIVYFDGRRVAMGDDLEPIVLFDQAYPGNKVLVAVKLLGSGDIKQFSGATLRIEFIGTRPNPSDMLQEILSAAVLAPSLGNDEQEVRRGIESAASSIDLEALKRADQKAFDYSLEKANAALVAIKPLLQHTSVRLTGNSHIDAAWLWPWTETVDVVRRTFSTALQLMEEYPQYTFTQSAAQYSEWMCEKYPGLCNQIAEQVKQGRWELVGGMWVEPDLNMPDGESLVRQLLVGKRYFKEKFGVDVRIGWNPDSFGYTWQLPQIYKKSGVDCFVTQKMGWNDTNQLPLKVFWWQSPDGSRVLTYFPHDYVNEIDPVRISSDLAKAHTLNPGLPEMMHLYGIGDHGGGPTRAMLDSGMHWIDTPRAAPKMFFGTAQGFFSDIEGKLDTEHSPVWNYKVLAKGDMHLPIPPEGRLSLPIWNDELYLEFHRGVMTTQANHKRNMRDSEEWMLNAEKYSSLAWLSGASYPAAELAEGWKKVLFNQFHDLAAGSGIGVIYRDAQRDYDAVHWMTAEVSSQALGTIAAEVNTKSESGGVPVLVMNPLAWDRTDVVEASAQMSEKPQGGISVLDAQGQPLPAQVLSTDAKTKTYHLLIEVKNAPSLGYEVLHIVPGARPIETDLKASGLSLENSFLRVVVDPQTGCLTSLYDKRSGFESIAAEGCGNELVAFQDTPKQWDAWNIDMDFDKVSTRLDMVDSVQLVEQGPLRATIRVVRTWQNSKFVQEIRLYAGLGRVDIVNDIDWHETHVLLKAAFPLAATSGEATYEIPYGSIERPTTRNNSWEAAKFEVPALRWADLGDGDHGFSLINESKYGYDAKGNVLRISLLRSPTWPDPDADRGHQHFSYTLYPHLGDWKKALTVRRGYEFNYKLKAVQVEAHGGSLPRAHSFVGVSQENVVVTALKRTEDGSGLLLRLYEWAGKSSDVELTVPSGPTRAILTNLMEQAEGSPLAVTGNNRVTVPVHPYEIVSVGLDYPHPSQASQTQ